MHKAVIIIQSKISQSAVFDKGWIDRVIIKWWSVVYNVIFEKMFSDKLKNLFTRSFSNNDEESLFERAASIISSARRTAVQNPTAEFQTYLQSLPLEQLKIIKNHKPRPSRTASLKPDLVVKCYRNVPKTFFDHQYELTQQFFTRNRKEASEKTSKMYEYLDEVEICLFNQISSRFDEILSVLRTIESLECIVDYNSNRLRVVRESNVSLAKTASQRHLKIVSLLKRQERLRNVIGKLAQVKIFSGFIQKDNVDLNRERKSHSQYYQLINEIRMRRQLYFQLDSTKNFEERVGQFESNLKKSYSDTINDCFFKYAVEMVPYDTNFWEKKFIGRAIFEEDQNDGDGTVILDESVLGEEEGGGAFNIKILEERQRQISGNVATGWRDGQYSTGNIKAAFDKFVKEKHLRFLSDCRNFCFQAYLREEREKIENPSIANLMQHMNVGFCSKTFVFYADMYRTMLTRCFSLVNRIVSDMLRVAGEQLTIEQKQKVTGVIDGLFSIVCFVFKLVYEKILEVIRLKIIYDQMQLQDFKQLVNVLQTEEDFIGKHIKKYTDIKGEGSFFAGVIESALSKFDFEMVTKAKQQKVISFLERTHDYILKNQLRESLENQLWKAQDIPTFYYDSLHYLISGESLNLRRNKNHTIRYNMSMNFESSVFIDRMGKEASMLAESKLMGNFRIIRNEIIIENKVYKVTTTLLLLLEIIEDYMHVGQFYPFVKEQVGIKIHELIRAYHTQSHKLIVKGLAVKLGKIKSKTITARHLALNSLCLSFLLYIIQCIRERVPIHEQAKIKEDLLEHYESIVKKLASILSGKVTQALPDVNLTAVPSKGTEAIVNSTKILHDILSDFYQKDVLMHIFLRSNVQVYLAQLKGLQVTSKIQAESLKDDMNFFFNELGFLASMIDDFESLRLQGQDIVRVKFQEL